MLLLYVGSRGRPRPNLKIFLLAISVFGFETAKRMPNLVSALAGRRSEIACLDGVSARNSSLYFYA